MKQRTAFAIAWLVWTLSMVALLVPFAYRLTGHRVAGLGDQSGSIAPVVAVLLFIPMFATVGAVLVAKRPTNPVGWLVSASGLCYALGTFAILVGHFSTRWSDWLENWVWGLGIGIPSTFVLLLFPTGHLPSRRWRPVAWFAGGVLGALFLGSALQPGVMQDTHSINPIGVGGPLGSVFKELRDAFGLVFLAALASVVSLVFRFRRAESLEREQIKWLVYAAALLVVAAIAGSVAPSLVDSKELGNNLQNAIISGAFVFVPLAIGIAVLKYRLYDIDVFINKTVVFGALAAFITAVYVGVVVGIGSAVGRGDQPNLGLSILATAVVAVAFQLVRERIQHLANRLVYGRRATPYEVLSRFSKGLAGTSGLEDLLSRLVRLLAEGTGAKNAQVWLRVSEQLVCEAAWPPDAEHPPPIPHRGDGDPVIPAAGRVVPVRHQGELLGVVALTKAPGDPITPGDDKLLADVASQAGLVLRNVRLVEELRASRQRIVAAQDEERRRLERDVHDGAQQQLVALALGIRMAETRLGGATNPKLAEALERADQELKETLSELRELARGIHPAILTERGLEPALRMLVERSPVPVDVESSLNSRLPPTVEATAYFVVAEALQNVAKYSGASAATVRVDTSAGELRVEVSDDGVGGADASRGSGLRGLMDRVAAVDGVLDVESAPGRGTRLTCRIPVRSRLQPRLMQGEASESVQEAEGESVGEPALR